MYRIAIDEAEDNSFCVSQFVLEDPAMTHDYNGLDYMVQSCLLYTSDAADDS